MANPTEDTPLVNQRTNLNGERESSKFFCTTCQAVYNSRIEHKAGSWTYICCGIWCILTFIGGLIPFCCNSCKDVVHYCPHCQVRVGEGDFKPI